jgi:hypothetical protein
MTPRENFLSVMNFEKPDRFPVMEFMGFWPEVEKLWQKQGLPENVNIFDYFGLVNYKFIDINFNFVPPFEEKVLEETDSHLIVIDPTGVTKKIEKNSSAMPHYIDFPIKSRKDFESIKERMDAADYKNRYPQNWDKGLSNRPNYSRAVCFLPRFY